MKLTTALLMLSILSLYLTPVYGCSIEFHVVSMTDWRFQARLEGPWFRASSWHWMEMGHAFDYESWGSFASCHGHWKLKIPNTKNVDHIFFWQVINVEVPKDAVVTIYIFGSDDDGYKGSYAKVKIVE